jgi:3-phenylpropionate/trans-cinnamate dioxygenase ferredoxin reductase subunit
MGRTIAIIGAGQAGAWVARTLRTEGYDGRIVLIGAERHPPYERPPLSKAVLFDAAAEAATTLLSVEQAGDAKIELWLAATVDTIDRAGKTLHCADGRTLSYDRLFLTTGSRPRWPDWAPAGDTPHIHRLRTLDDAAKLRDALQSAGSLLIIGGGWIGLEVAASARKQGVAVTVYEAADRICARSLPAMLSDWLADLHRDKAVDLLLRASIVGVEEGDDRVTVHFSDGTTATADHLLIGIGNIPETALAEAAGLDVSNGIVVDATGRTSDPDIYAAGDVASLPCPLAAAQVRRESWANAQNQAIVAAKAALGQDVRYEDIPWLWSDQHDVNIQIVGMPERAETLRLKPGKTETSGCWLALDAAGIPIGAVAVDAARDIRAARKLIQQKQPISADDWA